MGQRANLIVIANGQRETYYTHHRANTLDRDLFWGPDFALGFIRAQRPVGPDDLLDDIWAEGGAVMDLDKKMLLWFGGEDMMGEVLLRRVHARLMAALWPGWTIMWAAEGMADIARYIGVPMERVLSGKSLGLDEKVNLASALNCVDSSTWCIASVCPDKGPLRLAMLDFEAQEILLEGEKVFGNICAACWPPNVTCSRLPWSGFHIDERNRALHFWLAHPGWSTDALRQVQSLWPNWKIHWYQDRFEPHVEILGGAFCCTAPDESALIQELTKILLRPNTDWDGAQAAMNVARAFVNGGLARSIQINPQALFDARLKIPLEQRRQLFATAVAAVESEPH